MMQLELNQNSPLKMHIDLNSCFATATQQANRHLRGKPILMMSYVSPRGIVLAPSIEAKKLGIRTGMNLIECRSICKEVIPLMTDASLVRDVHIRLKRICSEYSSIIRPLSIDELVIDFAPMESILKRELTEIAFEIKTRIRKEIGEWMSCSIGIAPNRFLAKTGASLHKPDGLDVITYKNVREIYSKLTLIDLCGINSRFQARLNMCKIFTPLQFLDAPLDVLKHQVFQSINGYYWFRRLRGWEPDDVDYLRHSFGQDVALGKKSADPSELSAVIMKLCEKIGRRLRKNGYMARGMHIGLSYEDGTYWHRGRVGNRDLYASNDIYRRALLVFNQQPQRKVVTKVSVACFDLDSKDQVQQQLFEDGPEKNIKISDAMDKINNRYGEYTVTSAMTMTMKNVILDRIPFGSTKELEDLYETNELIQ